MRVIIVFLFLGLLIAYLAWYGSEKTGAEDYLASIEVKTRLCDRACEVVAQCDMYFNDLTYLNDVPL